MAPFLSSLFSFSFSFLRPERTPSMPLMKHWIVTLIPARWPDYLHLSVIINHAWHWTATCLEELFQDQNLMDHQISGGLGRSSHVHCHHSLIQVRLELWQVCATSVTHLLKMAVCLQCLRNQARELSLVIRIAQKRLFTRPRSVLWLVELVACE